MNQDNSGRVHIDPEVVKQDRKLQTRHMLETGQIITNDYINKRTVKREVEDMIAQLELLYRDPNSASWGIIDPTLEEAEAKRMAAECANDMLDDCIAIVREMKTRFYEEGEYK